MYYAQACSEFAEPISASVRPSNTAPSEEMSQRWRAVDTVPDLTGPRFEPSLPASETNALPLGPPNSNYLNYNKRKLKLVDKQKYITTQAKQTMLSTKSCYSFLDLQK